MVKRKVMIGAVAAALTLGGTAAFANGAGTTGSAAGSTQAETVNTASTSKKMISKTQAKAIALKAQKGKVDDIELKKRGGKAYYEVDIDRQRGDVDVWVDAYTGAVLKVVKDDDLTDNNSDDDRDDDRDDDDDDDRVGSAAGQNAAAAVKYTAAQASAIAVKHVGSGTVTDNDLDRDDGRYVYEIDIRTATGSADVKIDANTGKVLWSDIDNDDDDHDDDRYDDNDDDNDDDDN
ncbi:MULTISPECIES: PepSY domain-containing protein [Saccharibacillus]|uniref:PepSY domain-containing protein n=1 Tax=Saccharibacillus TaxID=456492 RepID=UPI00123A8E32|nr:PepSY domain-containing protein [Saccharibacillus sp. WB 17]MWJ31618.1 peptidase M4 [Saccharibacillus sp. WB 17]